MNPALKQRIVGAVMLVALGVIFLPTLFNGGRQQQEVVRMQIPSAPEIPPVHFKEPTRLAEMVTGEGQTKPASELFALEPKAQQEILPALKNPSKAPSLDSKGLPNAWALQVASFSDDKKAEELRKRLQKKNYQAFVRRVKQNDKILLRVMIGPELDKTKLASIKSVVDKEFKVKSLVVKFEA